MKNSKELNSKELEVLMTMLFKVKNESDFLEFLKKKGVNLAELEDKLNK